MRWYWQLMSKPNICLYIHNASTAEQLFSQLGSNALLYTQQVSLSLLDSPELLCHVLMEPVWICDCTPLVQIPCLPPDTEHRHMLRHMVHMSSSCLASTARTSALSKNKKTQRLQDSQAWLFYLLQSVALMRIRMISWLVLSVITT